MIRLEITGEHPAEFIQRLKGTLAYLLAGEVGRPDAAFLKRDAEARARGENIDGSPRRETVLKPESAGNPYDRTGGHGPDGFTAQPDIFPGTDEIAPEQPVESVTPNAPPRRGRKPKAEAAPAAETVEPEKPAEAITVEVVRDRVRNIINGYKATLDPADKEAEAKAVKYVMKLFDQFGIKKVPDLAADKYAEFMTESAAWLDGKKA